MHCATGFIGNVAARKKYESRQTKKDTKEGYDTLIECILASVKPQHYNALMTDWLVTREINTNNYETEEREKLRSEFGLGVESQHEMIIEVDTQQWIDEWLRAKGKTLNEALSNAKEEFEKNEKKFCHNFNYSKTEMMKEINFQVTMIRITRCIKQFNLGMELSEVTKGKEEQLTFIHIVDTLCKQSRPYFPKALEFGKTRKLKDSNPDSNPGIPLSPIILSEQPWPELQQDAFSYLRSFVMDIFLHWLKVWISLVLLKIVLT